MSSGDPGAQGDMGPGGTSLEFDEPGEIQRAHSKGHSFKGQHAWQALHMRGPGHRG